MSKQEKLILAFAVIVVLTRLGYMATDLWFATKYGAAMPVSDKGSLKAVFSLLTILQNVGAAVWIYVEARSAALRAWIWALLGLCFGVVGIAVFYLVQIYNCGQPNNSFKPKPLRRSA